MTPRLLWAVLCVVVVGFWLAPRDAAAFPWMVKYGHTTCSQCHADPSGGGLLTEYGRAQGEIVLRTVYKPRDADWEPGKASKFAFGAIKTPDALSLGYSIRYMGYGSQFESGASSQGGILMQSDVRAQVKVAGLRAYGSLGFAPFGARPASLTSNEIMNVISREHWIGYDVNDSLLIRAGRVSLPFGLRILEHTSYPRRYTRTDINSSQQHGVAASFSGERFRGEIMGVLGNLQVRPAEFRERGYSGYAEYTLLPGFAVGVSSLLAASELDIANRVPRVRQAHGIMARGAISQKLVAMGEIDALLEQLDNAAPVGGHTGFVGLDYEPIQGVHIQAMLEWLDTPGDTLGTSSGVWLSAIWYFAPHADFRFDIIGRSTALPNEESSQTNTAAMQLHFYL